MKCALSKGMNLYCRTCPKPACIASVAPDGRSLRVTTPFFFHHHARSGEYQAEVVSLLRVIGMRGFARALRDHVRISSPGTAQPPRDSIG